MNQPTAEAVEVTVEPKKELTDDDAKLLYGQLEEAGGKEKDFLEHLDSQPPVEYGPEETVKTEDKAKNVPETPAQETVIDAVETEKTTIEEVQPAPKETPVDKPVETLDVTEIERLKNVDQLYGRQANELGELRAVVRELDPITKNLNNPAFQRHVLGFFDSPQDTVQPAQPKVEFDPYDPNSMQRIIDQRVEQRLNEHGRRNVEQQNRAQQQNVIGTFNANTQKAREKAIAKGKTPKEVSEAENEFSKRFYAGELSNMALKIANYDSDISAAEQRGYQKAFKEIKDKQTATPRRTVAAETTKSEGEKTPLNETSVDELKREMDTLDPNSKRFDQIGRFLGREEEKTRRKR